MQKHEFEKDFYKLMNNAVFGKTMENVRNQRDIKLVTTDKRRCTLTSEPNYHSTKYISKDLLVMEMRKTEVKMNKPIYLGQAILDLSKTLMYEFWYDYIKPKFGDKARLCYMDTDSFVMYIKTEDFYKDISDDVDRWFDTSNFNRNDNRNLETGKNKKVLGKFKDELGGKSIVEFCALRAKAYAYKLFQNYVESLFKNEVLLRSQQRFRSDHHKVYTEEVNKIALSSNDDKRIQTFDKVTTYPYGTNTFTVCENEMKCKLQRKKMFNIDLKALRDKSLLLRNEAQALRTNSLLLRNELKELRAVSHDIKTKSYILRTKSQMLRNKSNDSQALRDKSLLLRNEAQALRNNSLLLRNELKELRAVSHDIKPKSCMLKTESQMIRNKSVKSEIDIIIDSLQKLRKESEKTRKESVQIIASSQKLREELRVIREESLRVIDRSRKLRKIDNDIKNDTDKAKESVAYKDIKPDTCIDIKPDKPNTSTKKDKANTTTKKDKLNTSTKKDKPNASKKKDKLNTSKKKDKPDTSEKKR